MRRIRRKTPHEPVTAIPASPDRSSTTGRAPRDAARVRTPRTLAALLNAGRPRLESRLPPPPEPESRRGVAAVVRPFRERVAAREGVAELLVFRVADEMFATELRAVEEAVEGVVVQPIPDAPEAMLGVFALRDRTLPVYALSSVLRLPSRGSPAVTLVVRPALARVALVVDAVDDVHQAALSAVRPAPGGDEADGAVLGVVWRGAELVTLLDPDALVATCLAHPPPDSV